MSDKQTRPQRSIKPRAGWHNSLTAQACGEAQFNQGNLYEASYQNRPILRLVYNPRDHELTGRSVVTVRCMLCGVKSRAFDSFEDYPMIGTMDVNTIRPTLKMSTERILNHLAAQHGEDLGGVDDLDFFNSIMDCCDI
jgi:hypothetical protein